MIPGIQDRHAMVRQGAERQAINAPLQGTSADLIKKAMIRIHQALKASNWPLYMLLQVHDELLFEGPEDVLEIWRPRLIDLMSGVASLDIPLEVTAGIGHTWDAVHA